ncbi:hypothetical protein ACHAWF_007380 [Thalassiosira exigua]
MSATNGSGALAQRKSAAARALAASLVVAAVLVLALGLGPGGKGALDDDVRRDRAAAAAGVGLVPRAPFRRLTQEERDDAEDGGAEGEVRRLKRGGRGRGAVPQVDFRDPKTVTPRDEPRPGPGSNRESLAQMFSAEVAAVEAIQASLLKDAEGATPDGAFFRVHLRDDGGDEGQQGAALFVPPEVWIEVVNPQEGCKYSVTLASHGRYTGTAALLTSEQSGSEETLVHAWRPSMPGRFDVLVHEIDGVYAHKTPLIAPGPFPIMVNEGPAGPGAGMAMLERRIRDTPPCSMQPETHVYTRWDGDWLGPEFGLEDSIRTGWSFVPSDRMNCHIETYPREVIRALPEKKRIYILGRSVERGIFLSLLDLMLDKMEKKLLKISELGKCWGRATVSKGNLEIMYQDFRVNAFEDPTKPRFVECHNEKMVKQPGSSFIHNATLVWGEVFERDPSEWPDVVVMVAGVGAVQFKFKHHVQFFVNHLPPAWTGTLILVDFEFSGRAAGLTNTAAYEKYLGLIDGLLGKLKDPRVRWLDGMGISKEMRMYGQKSENGVTKSQHFHRPCFLKDARDPSYAMVTCSNVTEMVAQLLLGHALGPKAELIERIRQNPDPIPNTPPRWCHACPKCMIPFHITPNPAMECVEGPITAKAGFVDCSVMRNEGAGGEEKGEKDPLLCPEACLATDPISSFGTESDTVFVRQCPIEEDAAPKH